MSFVNRVLQTPSYQWADSNGDLVIPSAKTLFKEAFSRINVFKSKKNWLPLASWSITVIIAPAFIYLLTQSATWYLFIFAFFYGMFAMSTHATIWYHRYCTHGSFKFSHPIWRQLTRHLVIKMIPEETYVVSHHIHHLISDKPGDPYNSNGGFLYCMLADVNHQGISKDLSEADYEKVSHYLKHTGVRINSYKQYQKWGSVSSPFYSISTILLNWMFWYTAFYFIGKWVGAGGHELALSAFSAALFWFVLVRAFNYTGHGGGEVKHVDGIDFDRSNLSINQTRPGYFSGEWHNNHHLYPNSARCGFLRYQLDSAWIYIWCLNKIGGISQLQNDKENFLRDHYDKET